MKIITQCPKCKKDIQLKEYKYFNDRGEISKKMGSKSIIVNCLKCSSKSEVEINKIKSEENLTLVIVLLIFSFFSTVFGLVFLFNLTINPKVYFLISIPWLIYFVFKSFQKTRVYNFNKYRV